MSGIFPDGAPAAAEADDTELGGIAALRSRPRHRHVEIGQQLGVRLGIHDRQQVLDVGHLGQVDALAEVIVGRDCECAELGQAPRHVLDVFVQAENLHRHDDHRRLGVAGGAGEIGRHLLGADLDPGVAGLEALGIRRDHLGTDGTCRKRVASGDGCGRAHESAARDRGNFRQPDDVGCHDRFETHQSIPSCCLVPPGATHSPIVAEETQITSLRACGLQACP
ncbi:hypothetical protein ACVINX_001306 [Bradyrhizobium diazoefficiens]